MRREDGTITTFALMVFILIGRRGRHRHRNIMRYETQRVQLQYTLDRAVLAAASVTQPLNPVDVVENYFEISGLDNYRLNVDVEQGVNFRRVNAYAELEINTLFMNMFGVRMLTSPAVGTAEEIIPNVEVSLRTGYFGLNALQRSGRHAAYRPPAAGCAQLRDPNSGG